METFFCLDLQKSHFLTFGNDHTVIVLPYYRYQQKLRGMPWGGTSIQAIAHFKCTWKIFEFKSCTDLIFWGVKTNLHSLIIAPVKYFDSKR